MIIVNRGRRLALKCLAIISKKQKPRVDERLQALLAEAKALLPPPPAK